MPTHPAFQALQAQRRGRERLRTQQSPDVVDDRGNVHALVGANPVGAPDRADTVLGKAPMRSRTPIRLASSGGSTHRTDGSM